jgi:hypothetical protein
MAPKAGEIGPVTENDAACHPHSPILIDTRAMHAR